MNKKILSILGAVLGILIIIAALLYINYYNKKDKNYDPISQESAVNVVTEFGKVLQKVPLTAEKDVIAKTIKKEYTPYISKDLLDKWLNEPASAPGRDVSSPWPDHIEITQTRAVGDEYQINGNLIYMTSNEVEHGGNAGIRQISAIVYMYQKDALITDFLVGEEMENVGTSGEVVE